MKDLRSFIRDVPDFPKPGIVFKDITPLLGDAGALKEAVDRIASAFSGERIDRVASPEARGFIFGSALAYRIGAGFIPIRKPKKLPFTAKRVTYELEYGSDAVEMHVDALRPGERILIVDDLLATGGTIAACAKLVESLGGVVVGLAFLVELRFLNGREKIPPLKTVALLAYDSP